MTQIFMHTYCRPWLENPDTFHHGASNGGEGRGSHPVCGLPRWSGKGRCTNEAESSRSPAYRIQCTHSVVFSPHCAKKLTTYNNPPLKTTHTFRAKCRKNSIVSLGVFLKSLGAEITEKCIPGSSASKNKRRKK